MICKIKETAPGTKVIILSDSPDSQEVISSIGVGANAYCLSDISPESLSNVIGHGSKGVFWVALTRLLLYSGHLRQNIMIFLNIK